MSAPLVSIKNAWRVLPAAFLGLMVGYLLRPGPGSGFSHIEENPPAHLTKDSPLGRSHGLPQTEARLQALLKAGSPTQQIAAALAFAEITSVEEIRELLENAHRFPAHSAEEVAIATLLKRWLDLDAPGAVEFCRRNKIEFLPELLANWGQSHPAEATAWVQAMPPGPAQQNAWLGLCKGTASQDPDKAWEMLGRTPGLDPQTGNWGLQPNIKDLVGRDVEKALANLETMSPLLVPDAQEAIAKQLMKTDPSRGWEWVRRLPQPARATLAVLNTSLSTDPAQAMAWLKSLPDQEQARLSSDFSYDYRKPNARELTAQLREASGIPETTKQKIAENVFYPYIWEDPSSALELISIMSSEGQTRAIKNSVERWARQDASALQTWIESLPEGPLRTAALDTQAKFTRPEQTPQLMQLTVDQLGKMMAGGLEENDSKQTDLLTKLGTINPSVAASWLEQTSIDSKTGPMAAQFSAVWAERDPAAAAAWVVKLPIGDLARTAAANVARQYQRYAPVEAAAWVQTLPAGPVREAAAKVIGETR